MYNQFNEKCSESFSELNEKYNLDIDYFQTGVMLYDTYLIEEETFQNLLDLSLKYPISITNEQAIISLYFTNIVPAWQQIPLRNEETFLYEYSNRGRNANFIMLKY